MLKWRGRAVWFECDNCESKFCDDSVCTRGFKSDDRLLLLNWLRILYRSNKSHKVDERWIYYSKNLVNKKPNLSLQHPNQDCLKSPAELLSTKLWRVHKSGLLACQQSRRRVCWHTSGNVPSLLAGDCHDWPMTIYYITNKWLTATLIAVVTINQPSYHAKECL